MTVTRASLTSRLKGQCHIYTTGGLYTCVRACAFVFIHEDKRMSMDICVCV